MMSSASTPRVPSIGWLLLMSTWLISVVIPGGWTAWLGFLAIGIIARLRRWVVVGVVLGALALLFALPVWGQWQSLLRAVLYLAGILLALAANPSWLRAMWARSQGEQTEAVMSTNRGSQNLSRAQRRQRDRDARQERERKAQQERERAQREHTQATKQRSEPAKERSDADRLAERAGASTADYFAASAASAEPIDVNEASASDLAGLPGLSRTRARRLISQRDKQGGFASLEAFATAAGLTQPHELMRLRKVATCSPPARGPRQFGRRVDY